MADQEKPTEINKIEDDRPEEIPIQENKKEGLEAQITTPEEALEANTEQIKSQKDEYTNENYTISKLNQAEKSPSAPQKSPKEEKPKEEIRMEEEKDVIRASEKGFNMLNYYEPGMLIDGMDTAKQWCAAYVVGYDRARGYVELHYEGWSQKYDTNIDAWSTHLAPFRYHSVGYTGNKRYAIRGFTFDPQELHTNQAEIEIILQSEFESLKAEQIVQYVRGKLFFYVDSLLTYKGGDNIKTKDDLLLIIQFLGKVMDLIILWLHKIRSLFHKYHEGKANKALYLHDQSVSLVYCLNEISLTLGTLFGRNERSVNFQKLIQIHFTSSSEKLSFLVKHLLGIWNDKKGFEHILKFFEKDDLSMECPLGIMVNILEPFTYGINLFRKELPYLEEFASIACQKLLTHLFHIRSEEDRLELDYIGIKRILIKLNSYLDIHYGTGKLEVEYQIEFSLAMDGLLSPNLRKRLDALDLIIQRIRVIQSKKSTQSPLNPKPFIDLLHEKDIIIILFGPNCHPQILQRSHPILNFLIEGKEFKSEYTKLIWKCITEKHEDIAKSTYLLLAEIILCSPYTLIQEFFKLIKAIPVEEYTDTFVEFLRIYTLNVFKNIESKGETVMMDGTNELSDEMLSKSDSFLNYDLYSIELFNKILDENINLTIRTREKAVQALKNTCKSLSLKRNYIRDSLNNLLKGNSFYTNSVLFMEMIANFDPSKDVLKESMSKYVRERHLFDICVSECDKYLKEARAIIKAKEIPDDQIIDYQFRKGFRHRDYLMIYFRLIEFVRISSKLEILLDNLHVHKLWQICVTKGIAEEADILFEYFLKRPKGDLAKRYSFSFLCADNASALFNQINSDHMPVASLKLNGFHFFKTFFLFFNESQKALQVMDPNSLNFQVNMDSLTGIIKLWHYAYLSSVPRVRDQAATFLVDIHMNLGPKIKHKKASITKKFFEMGVDYNHDFINSGLKSQEGYSTLFSIINSYLERCYESSYALPASIQPNKEPLIQIKIFIKPENREDNVKVYQNLTILKFKHYIANYLKMPKEKFILKINTKGKPMDKECDEIKLEKLWTTKKRSLIVQKISINNWKVITEETNAMANTDKLMKDLVHKTNSNNQEIANSAWMILEKLPFNQQQVNKLQNLDIHSGPDHILNWNNFLSTTDPKRVAVLCYNYFVMEEFFYPIKISLGALTAVEEYKTKFIAKFGFEFLMNNFVQISQLPNLSLIILKGLASMFRVLISLISSSQFYNLLNDDKKRESTMNEASNMVVKVIEESIKREKNSEERIKEFEHIESQIVKSYIILITKYCINSTKAVLIISKSGLFTYILQLIYGNSKNDLIQKEMSKHLLDVLRRAQEPEKDMAFAEKRIYSYIMNILLTDILTQIDANELSFLYYKHVSRGIRLSKGYRKLPDKSIGTPDLRSELDLDLLVKKNILMHLNEKILGGTLNTVGLAGYLLIFGSLLSFHHLNSQIPDKTPVFQYIFKLLFPFEGDSTVIIYGDPDLKAAAIDSMLILCRANPHFIYLSISQMMPHFQLADWRRSHSWNIMVDNKVRSGNPIGLENPGNICYANALIQQFFRIKSFRHNILQIPLEKELRVEENVLYQLQLLFGGLTQSKQNRTTAIGLIQNIKDIEGNSLNIHEQKDVDEFFNMFMERLESALPSANLIKQEIGGYISTEIIGKECPHRSERCEECQSILLFPKGKRSILEALEAYIKSEMLEGENAYFCQQCDAKVSAEKRTSLKLLPNTLVLVLKRFEFNYTNFTKYKVNEHCSFPFDLDMRPYCQEYLSSSEEEEEEGREKGSECPSYYYSYKLRGILLHEGTADQGHYTSVIYEEEKEEWFMYNDTHVSSFDPKRIPEVSFGGTYTQVIPGKNLSQELRKRDRLNNAYVLFYDRVKRLDLRPLLDTFIKEVSESVDWAKTQLPHSQLESTLPYYVTDTVSQTNTASYIKLCLFDPDILATYSKLLLNILPNKQITYDEGREVYFEDFKMQRLDKVLDPNQTPVRYALMWTFTILMRSKSKTGLFPLINHLTKCIKDNIPASIWIINLFSYTSILQEFFLFNYLSDLRRMVVELLIYALDTLYPLEEFWIEELVNGDSSLESLIGSGGALSPNAPCYELNGEYHTLPFTIIFLHNLIHSIPDPYLASGIPQQIFQLLLHFTLLGKQTINYLIKLEFVGILFSIIKYQGLKQNDVLYFKLPDFHLANIEVDSKIVQGTEFRQFIYVFPALFNILKHCAVRNSDNLETKKRLQEHEEIEIYKLTDTTFLESWFKFAICRRSTKWMGDIINYVCEDNEDNSNQYYQYLLTRIIQLDYDQFNPHLQSILSFIKLNDKLRLSRVGDFLNRFRKIMRDTQQSYVAYTVLLDFFIKIVYEIKDVRIYMNKNKVDITFMKSWVEKFGVIQSNHPLYLLKSGNIRMGDFRIQKKEDEGKIKQLNNARKDALKNILNMMKVYEKQVKILAKEKEKDKEKTTSIEPELKQGMWNKTWGKEGIATFRDMHKIDINLLGVWRTVNIKESTDQLAKVEYLEKEDDETPVTSIFEIDSDVAAPAMTLSQNLNETGRAIIDELISLLRHYGPSHYKETYGGRGKNKRASKFNYMEEDDLSSLIYVFSNMSMENIPNEINQRRKALQVFLKVNELLTLLEENGLSQEQMKTIIEPESSNKLSVIYELRSIFNSYKIQGIDIISDYLNTTRDLQNTEQEIPMKQELKRKNIIRLGESNRYIVDSKSYIIPYYSLILDNVLQI